jgi:hypothetical protein
MIVENNLMLFPISNFPLDFEALYFGFNSAFLLYCDVAYL